MHQEMARQEESLTLGQQIRAARKALKLTQTQLGDRVGKNWAHINRLEAGSRLPSLELLNSIARETGARFVITGESVPERIEETCDMEVKSAA